MTTVAGGVMGSTAHALNNLLCKIMGVAELALDHAQDPSMEANLQMIMTLAEEAADLVGQLREPGV